MTAPEGPDLTAGIELDSIAEGTILGGRWNGKKVVVANDRGRLCAFSGTCTHMSAPLAEGTLIDGEIHCPWHHARFSSSTGQAVGAPAFAPLTRYGTVVRDGRLFVTDDRPAAAEPTVASRAASRVVIVGGGAGGYACAQWLASTGFHGMVTMVSDDTDPPYDRTVCSKQYLIGMQTRQKSLLAHDGLYESGAGHPVLRLGSRARAIDTADRAVILANDERLPFDTLVLATGAEPKRPATPGFDLPNVHVLRTLRDADSLIGACDGAHRVAVVGSSFIGLEAAASLRQRKLDVHVITPDSIPLEKRVGSDVGRMIQAVHEEKGVRFQFRRTVQRFDGRRLTLDDGTSLEVDFVVLGVGVTPRTQLAEAAGLSCATEEEGGGVIVNASLESSHPGIFAIGDIARYPDPHTRKMIRVEHWVHAQRQGQHVARVIRGDASAYADVPFFWSAHFDTGLRYLGHVGSITDTQTDGSIDGRNFARHYRGPSGERAFVTCNRDLASLQEESAWDHALPGYNPR